MVYRSQNKGMSLIVKTVTRLTLAFILIYGIYIGTTGYISPGGGFTGGVILALAFVHIMLAFGKEAALRKLRANTLGWLWGPPLLYSFWAWLREECRRVSKPYARW